MLKYHTAFGDEDTITNGTTGKKEVSPCKLLVRFEDLVKTEDRDGRSYQIYHS